MNDINIQKNKEHYYELKNEKNAREKERLILKAKLFNLQKTIKQILLKDNNFLDLEDRMIKEKEKKSLLDIELLRIESKINDTKEEIDKLTISKDNAKNTSEYIKEIETNINKLKEKLDILNSEKKQNGIEQSNIQKNIDSFYGKQKIILKNNNSVDILGIKKQYKQVKVDIEFLEENLKKIEDELTELETIVFDTSDVFSDKYENMINLETQKYNRFKEYEDKINKLKYDIEAAKQEILKYPMLYEGEICPICGEGKVEVKYRTAKYGPYLFYSCSTYSYSKGKSNCKVYEKYKISPEEKNNLGYHIRLQQHQIINLCNEELRKIENYITDVNDISEIKTERIVSTTTTKKSVDYHDYHAYPASFGSLLPVKFSFQSITIPSQLFKSRENYPELREYSKFIVTYKCNKNSDVEIKERAIYSLALRLMNRGIVLPIYKKTEEKLKKFNKVKSGYITDLINHVDIKDPVFCYDSDREKRFATQILPKVKKLGNKWPLYTLTQVGFDMLLPNFKNCSNNFFDQRVDFLISKGNKKIVIELDGEEHEEKEQADKQRDSVLINNGYFVLRFKNLQIDYNPNAVVKALDMVLEHVDVDQRNFIELDASYLVACKLVHQFSIAILKALEQGYLLPRANVQIKGDSNIFLESDLNYILAVSIEEVEEIINNYIDIYGLNLDICLCDSSAPKFNLVLGDNINTSDDSAYIMDNFIPYNYYCHIESLSPNIFPKNVNESAVEFFLNYIYGFEHLRDGQYAAIERLLSRLESIILLPTGAGKSIIYQLSSYISTGITIVISPLKALIDDQIYNLEYNTGITNVIGIRSKSKGQKDNANKLEIIQNNIICMIYIAPERLLIPSFRNAVHSLMNKNFVFTVAIDEAHCVSEWGHDFRASYLSLSKTCRTIFKKDNYIPTIFALTGTASERVLRDVAKILEITDEEAIIYPESFDRKELHFRVIHTPVSNKVNTIIKILQEDLPKEFDESYNNFIKLCDKKTKSGIVFTPFTKMDALNTYGALSVNVALHSAIPEIGCGCYFSTTPKDFTDEDWEENLHKTAKSYKSNKLNLLIATKAFGMGIDKSNIRYIIHEGFPSSLEQYYQEAGRAGRGRDDSYCYIIFSNDFCTRYEKLLSADLDAENVKKSYEEVSKVMKDDLGNLLYFHLNSFSGRQAELDAIKKYLNLIKEKNYSDGVTIRLRDTKLPKEELDELQKTIVRFINLGFVKDYTYDYSRNFDITCGTLNKQILIDNFIEFVMQDNIQRAKAISEKISKIKTEQFDFVYDLSKELIDYTYDNIEKSRRNSIEIIYNVMKNAVELDIKKQDKYVRESIESYFTLKDRKVSLLSSITQQEHAGIKIIKTILGKAIEKDKYQNRHNKNYRDILMKTGRRLEAYPDHPSLLFIKTICSMYLENIDDQQFVDEITLSLQYFLDRYSVDKNIVITEVSLLSEYVYNYNLDLFKRLINTYSIILDIPKDEVLYNIISYSRMNPIPDCIVLMYSIEQAKKVNEVLKYGKERDTKINK